MSETPTRAIEIIANGMQAMHGALQAFMAEKQAAATAAEAEAAKQNDVAFAARAQITEATDLASKISNLLSSAGITVPTPAADTAPQAPVAIEPPASTDGTPVLTAPVEADKPLGAPTFD